MDAVKNLGSWSDETMSMVTHINNIFFRKYPTTEATQTLAQAMITGRIDYCNSLLYKIPAINAILQYVQNCSARLVSYIPRFNHIAPILYQLHWLPVA